MKVYMGKYKTNWTTYGLAEILCFWAPKVKDEIGRDRYPDWVHDFGEFLAYGFQKQDSDARSRLFSPDTRRPSFLLRFCELVNRWRGQRDIRVRIDSWDTWSMDSTLTPIILPMLYQLKKTKHGSPGDMLEFSQVSDQGYQHCFDFYEEGNEAAWDAGHARWSEILDKMIWSFEQLSTDWESQFHHGESDLYLERLEDGTGSLIKKGPGDTHWLDTQGLQAHDKRIQEGLELFGRYFRNLWD